jgi:hypothetical protein
MPTDMPAGQRLNALGVTFSQTRPISTFPSHFVARGLAPSFPMHSTLNPNEASLSGSTTLRPSNMSRGRLMTKAILDQFTRTLADFSASSGPSSEVGVMTGEPSAALVSGTSLPASELVDECSLTELLSCRGSLST